MSTVHLILQSLAIFTIVFLVLENLKSIRDLDKRLKRLEEGELR